MDAQTAKVAGGSTSLTNKAAGFERLPLDRTFADKQLGTAFSSLEQARNDAPRKQLYLERIVQPNRPDVAVQPRRMRPNLATIFARFDLSGCFNHPDGGRARTQGLSLFL